MVFSRFETGLSESIAEIAYPPRLYAVLFRHVFESGCGRRASEVCVCVVTKSVTHRCTEPFDTFSPESRDAFEHQADFPFSLPFFFLFFFLLLLIYFASGNRRQLCRDVAMYTYGKIYKTNDLLIYL